MSVCFSGWSSVEDGKLSEEDEPQKGNTYTMYHGTHLTHAPTIITRGFQRSRDGLLGAGVYVSRNVKKALCYPQGVGSKEKVVFKLHVRVGKVKKIDRDNHPLQKSWHQHGYDCAWVPPHSNIATIRSGREEDCVWDPSRITVVDVVFCEDKAKQQQLRGLIQSSEGAGTVCAHCHQDQGANQHPVQSCWGCGKTVCPFQKKHVCKRG